jgi:hypothetical protein
MRGHSRRCIGRRPTVCTGLCLRMSGDGDRAAELVQDVFVRVWERLGS